jgi:hypothetical protein
LEEREPELTVAADIIAWVPLTKQVLVDEAAGKCFKGPNGSELASLSRVKLEVPKVGRMTR